MHNLTFAQTFRLVWNVIISILLVKLILCIAAIIFVVFFYMLPLAYIGHTYH